MHFLHFLHAVGQLQWKRLDKVLQEFIDFTAQTSSHNIEPAMFYCESNSHDFQR